LVLTRVFSAASAAAKNLTGAESARRQSTIATDETSIRQKMQKKRKNSSVLLSFD